MSAYSQKRTFALGQDLHRQDRAGLRFPGISLRSGGAFRGRKDLLRFIARAIRLYEQEPGGGCVPPPGLDCTCDVGSGGFRRGCLKVVRHLKNCKFTTLADAVEGTRTIWRARPAHMAMARAHVDRGDRRRALVIRRHGSSTEGCRS